MSNIRTFVLTLLLLICLMTRANELKSHLLLWNIDGTKVAYALKEQPVITFDEDNLVLSTDNIEISYPLTALAKITYGAVESEVPGDKEEENTQDPGNTGETENGGNLDDGSQEPGNSGDSENDGDIEEDKPGNNDNNNSDNDSEDKDNGSHNDDTEDPEGDGIEGIVNPGNADWKFDGDYILFTVEKAGTDISVVSLTGETIFREKINAPGEYSYPLNRLSPGIYVIRINNLANKVIIK